MQNDQTVATDPSQLQARVAELEAKLAEYEERERQATRNLELFHELEFVAFGSTPPDWGLFKQLHGDNVLVRMPDGLRVQGLEQHTKDMVDFLSFVPDLRVQEQPVRIAQGDWTAVMGRITGTFTEPMPLPEGGFVAPTNKALNLEMVTLARWEDGEIAEELLFWDNRTFEKQLGLAAD